MEKTVIIAGARTPVGRLLGSLSGLSGADLGAIAIRGALERSGVSPQAVDYVIMGQVLTAGAGQMPARQAAIKAGVSAATPCLTVNKVCLSGIQSIMLGDQFIRSGTLHTVVAGGQESMSQAPHLQMASRTGHKYGTVTMADHMELDGLHDATTDQSMGLLTEQYNDSQPLPRPVQDEFAAKSHRLAARAQDTGLFDDEIVPVEVPQRRGAPVMIDKDEGVRPETTAEVLGRLRPAFREDGTVTAGNSSPISDGACALVLMSKSRAEAQGIPWLAEIGSVGMAAGPDSTLQLQPANAIREACEREGILPTDLDLVEINEAFAAVGLASIAKLGIDPERVNVNGGAIALGHPIGMSGARIVLHLAIELARRGGGVGAAALCGGGGQGDALIVRVPKEADKS
ncbi:acetyl-CoA C-acetyltransferase [Pseudarthrobacter raffinosi]|uniref:acetyl-CoA C-acetyltransferase n=1 Tax=Pseudarthrobacter raffinosi TaxID=2953651 RepID=UPI00208F84C6|nr:acetyl-CoA C-acetyltransferase [Pseudarthrobacter sp. MDT3-9]MCO4253337.1 acetyl-CoA C-acetyltransferase [Pseudarthrobacter sp. MDT3-9]